MPVTVIDHKEEFGTLGEALAHHSRLETWLRERPTPADAPKVPMPTEESLLKIIDKPVHEWPEGRDLPTVKPLSFDPRENFDLI